MKKSCFLSIISLALCIPAVHAQYLSSKEVVTKEDRRKQRKLDNIVKIAPLGFTTGAFPVLYEKRINNFFTVQAGAGLTGKNILRNALQSATDFDYTYPGGNNAFNDVAEERFKFKFRRAGIGYMFTIQPRLYFESEAPDGAYVALSYDYYRYNFSIPGILVQNGQPVHNGAVKKEYENINDIMANFGYQFIFKQLTLDASGGLGLRSAKGIKYVAEYNSATPTIATEGFADYAQSIISFGIGVKVGYHF